MQTDIDDTAALPIRVCTQCDFAGNAHSSAFAEALAAVEAQKSALETALREREATQRQLKAELDDARLLHDISAMLVDEESVGVLYQQIVDAATLIMRSDFGSMQRFDEERRELQLIAHQGLDDDAVAFWEWVYPNRPTTCGKALATGERVVISDFETCSFIANSKDLIAFRAAGVRSAQSTPLLTRNGRLVGMITTHWTREHEPGERELQLLDIVARQAADLIERNSSMAALRAQGDRLLAADRHKNEFLATLAHELRNPLAPIRTGMSLLTLGTPDQARRVLPIMERQLGQMVRLIDDLLDVSRISSGKVTLKRSRVTLASIMESAIEESQPLITAAGHRFLVTMPGTPVWLDADPTRITQIISNLLNNAAKYTPHGGRITLVADVENGALSVRITDNGIGIKPKMLLGIFELFTQVEGSIERSQGGLGVGLALARRLAEMHGGGIEVESPGQDGGSIFTLRLPLGIAGDEDAFILCTPALTVPPARILVVDDNADAADTLALLLTQLGHTTQIELDSSAVLDAARGFVPDIVFLDLNMPQLSGYDVAGLLRNEPALASTFIAAVSGWGTDEHRARSRVAGMDAHLTKPFMVDEVNALLVSAFATQTNFR